MGRSQRGNCANSPTSRAPMTAATAISPRAKISSSIGRSCRMCRTCFWSSPKSKCIACRRAATMCAISPPILLPARARTKSRIRASSARSCGNGPRCIPNFPFCRASSRFASLPRSTTAPRSIHDIAIQAVKNEAGEIGYRVYVGGGLGRTPFSARKGRIRARARHSRLSRSDPARLQSRAGATISGKRGSKFWCIRSRIEEMRAPLEKEFAEIKASGHRSNSRPKRWRESPPISHRPILEPVECPEPFEAASGKDRIRRLGRKPMCIATKCRAMRRDHLAQGHRRHPRRLLVRSDGRLGRDHGYSQRRSASPMSRISSCRICARRSPALSTSSRRSTSPRRTRAHHRHHRLPRPRLLRSRQCPFDSHRAGDCQALCRRAPARTIGPLKIKISGCINACGHHHVGHIGILGVERNGEETYQILLGGSADENAAIGQILGPGFSSENIVGAIDTIVETYMGLRRGRRRLSSTRSGGSASRRSRRRFMNAAPDRTSDERA